MKKNYFDNVGYIYKFWYKIFMFIESVLPFSILRRYCFKNTKNFSDKWVIVHTLLSIGFAIITYYYQWGFLMFVVFSYSILRILEIIVYQINVLLFHPYRAIAINRESGYKLQNPYRSVVLLGHNFIEVIFWFTCASNYFSSGESTLIETIMDNTIRIFTLNYEKITNGSSNLQVIFFAEVVCGMILTIISLAKFLGELPHVDIRVEEEND